MLALLATWFRDFERLVILYIFVRIMCDLLFTMQVVLDWMGQHFLGISSLEMRFFEDFGGFPSFRASRIGSLDVTVKLAQVSSGANIDL